MTVSWHPLADAPRMIAAGEVTDAKTVVGLLLAQRASRLTPPVDGAARWPSRSSSPGWRSSGAGRPPRSPPTGATCGATPPGSPSRPRRGVGGGGGGGRLRAVARGVGAGSRQPGAGHRRRSARCTATSPSRAVTEADAGADVAVPSVPAGLPKALTEAQVGALLDSVGGDRPVDRRDRAILEVLYGTGVRIAELVGLSLADVDLDGGLLRAFGKGRKERIVPLGRLARQSLEQWLDPGGRPELVPARWARRGDAEAVFLNQRGGRLSRQGAWLVVRAPGRRAGLGGLAGPTCCATAAPRTCSSAAPTSARCRSCWATPASPPPRCTPRSPSSGCAASTTRPTPEHADLRPPPPGGPR